MGRFGIVVILVLVGAIGMLMGAAGASTPYAVQALPDASLNEAQAILIAALMSLVGAFTNSALGGTLISAIKTVFNVPDSDLPKVSLGVGVALWVIALVAGVIGFRPQLEVLSTALVAIVPALVTLIGGFMGQAAVYRGVTAATTAAQHQAVKSALRQELQVQALRGELLKTQMASGAQSAG